jgi:hypothetical protein
VGLFRFFFSLYFSRGGLVGSRLRASSDYRLTSSIFPIFPFLHHVAVERMCGEGAPSRYGDGRSLINKAGDGMLPVRQRFRGACEGSTRTDAWRGIA